MLQRLRSARAGVANAPAARKTVRQRAEAPGLSRQRRRIPAAGLGPTRMQETRPSPAASPRLRRQLLADEENSAIIDVGSRRSGSEEVAQGLEEARRIVL